MQSARERGSERGGAHWPEIKGEKKEEKDEGMKGRWESKEENEDDDV